MKNFYGKKRINGPKCHLKRIICSERGSYEFTSGMNGGAGQISEQRKEYKCHAYDSYVKKVLRNELYKSLREYKNRRINEVPFSELPEAMISEFGKFDEYPWEHAAFCVDGQVVHVKNDCLAHALELLPQKERNILLMYYFLNMSDQEISAQLNITRRRANKRRHIAFRLLQKLMGGDLRES